MAERYFGIALFGLGRAGTIHFHNLRRSPRVDLLYIIEADLDKAQKLVEQYRIKDVTVLPPEKSQEAIKDSRVEAIVVATPTFTHQATVLEAVAEGKAVFCEKPIAQNAEATKKCYEAAAKKKVPLLCSFNRRYDPTILEVKRQLESGAIGELHMVKSCARDHPRPPNSYLSISGGFFHDCAVHDLDLICWMVGQYPSEVHAYSHVYDAEIQAMNDVDTVIISLKFPNGCLAIIDISRHANYGYDQRLELFGQHGMLQSKNQTDKSFASYNDRGMTTDKLKHSFPQRYAESYVNALDNFFDILEGKKPEDVTMHSTLEISRLASACEESSKLGKNIKMADFVETRH